LNLLEFIDDLEAKLTRKDLPFPVRSVNFEPPTEVGLEKIFGVSHLKSVAWLQRGVAAAASVCRVVTPNGLGTGFVIAGKRLLTNCHVIPSEEIASHSRVDCPGTMLAAATRDLLTLD